MTKGIRAGTIAAILGLALTVLAGTAPMTFAGCGDDGASLTCQGGSSGGTATPAGLDNAGGN